MRCNNCGWNNPDGVSKCQKCNQPLVMETVPLSQMEGSSTIPMGNLCPNCGYAISEGTVICPICKTEIKKADDGIESVSDFENTQKTVMMDAPKGNSNNQQIDVKHTVVDVQPVHSAAPAASPKIVDLKKTGDDAEELKQAIDLYSFSLDECFDELQKMAKAKDILKILTIQAGYIGFFLIISYNIELIRKDKCRNKTGSDVRICIFIL